MDRASRTKECIDRIQRVLSYAEFAPDCTDDRELCDILSDGEILCNLVTQLSNGAIDYEGATYYSQSSHFLARKHLTFFITQCREVFKLEEEDLFEPDELLNASNPEKVVKTVLKLTGSAGSTKEAESKEDPTSSSLLQNVVKEICDHEKALIDKLAILLTYRSELLGTLSEWSEELVKTVFKHTEQLYLLHKEMLEKLTSLAEQGSEEFCKQLNTLFSQFTPKLKVYFDYFAHLPTANARMQSEFAQSPQLAAQLSLLDRRFNGLSFRGLYEAPIRQTTNYLQLFKRLHKAAKAESAQPEASKSVEDAMIHMEALLLKANEFKKQTEQLNATRELLAQVSGLPHELSSPESVGLHIADEIAKVQVVVNNKRSDSQQCLCILTKKQLILATRGKKDTQAAFWLNVPVTSSLEVQQPGRGGGLKMIQESGDTVKLEESKTRCHDLKKWIGLISSAKEENFPKGWNSRGHTFRLKTLPPDSQCSRCCETLTGQVMQGYSCAHCGKLLDLQCLQKVLGMTANDYYHPNLDRDGAEELLMKQSAVGSFLLRNSRVPGSRALSIRSEKKVEHISIDETNGRCSLGKALQWHNSLDELLDFYRENMMSVHFSAINFKLGEGVEPKKKERRSESLVAAASSEP